MLGKTYAFGIPNSYDFILSKMSQNGNLEWVKILGGAGKNSPKSMLIHEDGSLLCLGHTSGYGEGSYDIVLFKLTPDGELLWAKTFGTPST